MQDETDKKKNFKRFILLIFIPLMTIMFILGFFYSLGRYITTENAYIKAPIISIQSQIPGRVKTVFVKDNQQVKKGQKLFKIDTAKLKLDLSEQKQNLLTIKKEIDNRKSKYNEAREEIKLAEISKEKRILLGALLIPNKPIYRNGSEGDYYIFFSKDTISKASQMYLRNGYQNNSTLEHSKDLKGLTLVESWIVEDEVQDKSRKYGLHMPVGAWMVSVKVNNDEIWEEFVKTKRVKGFSIEGFFSDKLEMNKEVLEDKLTEQEVSWLEQIKEILKDA